MKRKEMHYCQQVDGNVHKIFLYDDISKYGEWNWETWDYDESETSAHISRSSWKRCRMGKKLNCILIPTADRFRKERPSTTCCRRARHTKWESWTAYAIQSRLQFCRGAMSESWGTAQARLSTTCGPASQEMQNSSGKRRTSWTCVWNPVCS